MEIKKDVKCVNIPRTQFEEQPRNLELFFPYEKFKPKPKVKRFLDNIDTKLPIFIRINFYNGSYKHDIIKYFEQFEDLKVKYHKRSAKIPGFILVYEKNYKTIQRFLYSQLQQFNPSLLRIQRIIKKVFGESKGENKGYGKIINFLVKGQRKK